VGRDRKHEKIKVNSCRKINQEKEVENTKGNRRSIHSLPAEEFKQPKRGVRLKERNGWGGTIPFDNHLKHGAYCGGRMVKKNSTSKSGENPKTQGASSLWGEKTVDLEDQSVQALGERGPGS